MKALETELLVGLDAVLEGWVPDLELLQALRAIVRVGGGCLKVRGTNTVSVWEDWTETRFPWVEPDGERDLCLTHTSSDGFGGHITRSWSRPDGLSSTTRGTVTWLDDRDDEWPRGERCTTTYHSPPLYFAEDMDVHHEVVQSIAQEIAQEVDQEILSDLIEQFGDGDDEL